MNITLKSLTDVGENAYFDDIRMHPYHANMKSFVYDPVSLRLMAELDENNYASFYEHDNFFVGSVRTNTKNYCCKKQGCPFNGSRGRVHASGVYVVIAGEISSMNMTAVK